MPRFDLDAQRGLVCLFGLTALTAEGIGFYLTGKTLPDIFTGGFITMAMGPLLSAWAEKYREEKTKIASPPPPPSPEASSPPTTPDGAKSSNAETTP